MLHTHTHTIIGPFSCNDLKRFRQWPIRDERNKRRLLKWNISAWHTHINTINLEWERRSSGEKNRNWDGKREKERKTLCDKKTVGKLTDFSECCPSSLPLSVYFSLSVPLFLHWDIIFIVYAWILPVENNLQRDRKSKNRLINSSIW